MEILIFANYNNYISVVKVIARKTNFYLLFPLAVASMLGNG